MNEKILPECFGLSAASMVPLSGGTVAQVWRVDTAEDSYLLRTLTGREQGEREQTIVRHLYSRGFTNTPEILAMAEREGVWYQLQRYHTGSMPDPAQPGVAAAMGKTAAALALALSDLPGGPWIHGDLGPWNMLLHEGEITVLDFGAARPGDPCFDFAALFGGVINHTPEESRRQVCGEFLTSLNCRRDHLLEQLSLWAREGTGRWQGVDDAMTARFSHALRWAEENLYDL